MALFIASMAAVTFFVGTVLAVLWALDAESEKARAELARGRAERERDLQEERADRLLILLSQERNDPS